MKLYLIIYIVFFLGIHEVLAVTQEWINVMISEEYLTSDTFVKRFNLDSRVQCATICARFPLCKLWCQNGQDRCIISATYVHPKYNELGSNLVKCYTRSRRDLAIESTSTESSFALPDTKAEVAIDGIFLAGFTTNVVTRIENGLHSNL